MIRRKNELRNEVKMDMRGGKGAAAFNYFLEETEAQGSGRIFSRTEFEPGCSIGYHKHEGELEIFYITAGTAKVCDNGTDYILKAGDTHTCFDGGSHSIENTGSDKLEFLALVLYTQK